MVYGYVNRRKGEAKDYLQGREFDEIFYQDGAEYDLSFLKQGDTIILCKLKSISDNLKDILVFAQYAYEEMTDIINSSGKLNPSEMKIQDQIEFLMAIYQFAEHLKPLVIKYADKLPEESTFLLKL